ncbi:MAG: sulfite exporter TauE/SafE family protein [Burkholderiaceae bacterium]|nr:sulfite exporter TauE/SafE family protein [Burkholderiaceae bacterium]
MDHLVPQGLSVGWAVALVVAAFFTAGISAAFGLGGGVAMLAILLMVLPPATVLPIHGIVQAGSNAGRAVSLRTEIRRSLLGWFAAGTVIGIVAASLVLVALPTSTLQWILGLFILWSLWGPKPRGRRVTDAGFLAVGAGASFCTMFVGATGPMVAAFWDVKRMGRLAVVATHAACMLVQHMAKVVAFGVLGFAFTDWAALVAAMLLAGQAGTMAGARILRAMPERVFATAFKAVLTALALRLLWSAWQG